MSTASANGRDGILIAVDHTAVSVVSVASINSSSATMHPPMPSKFPVANELLSPKGTHSHSGWSHGFSTPQPLELHSGSSDRFAYSLVQRNVSYDGTPVVEYGPAGSAAPAGLRALLLHHLMTHGSETSHAQDAASMYHLAGHVDATSQHIGEHLHLAGIAQSEASHSLSDSHSHLGQLDLHATTFHIDHLH